MQKVLEMVPDIIQLISLAGMCISILATIVVRITPSKSDDEKLAVFLDKFLRVVQWLPTIGVNPRTQKLEETLKELQEQQKK